MNIPRPKTIFLRLLSSLLQVALTVSEQSGSTVRHLNDFCRKLDAAYFSAIEAWRREGAKGLAEAKRSGSAAGQTASFELD